MRRRVAPSLAYTCTGADDTPMLRRHWWLLWLWEELRAANSNVMRESRDGMAIEIKASGRERSPLPPALPLQPAGRRAGAPMQRGGVL